MTDTARPWWACTGDPCTCLKPADDAGPLAPFTTAELQAEIDRRLRDAHEALHAALGARP